MKRAVLLLLAASCATALAAGDETSAARQVLERNRDAVVTVQLVVSFNFSAGGSARQNESRTEAVGTVVDPGGLTVISLTAIDPSALMKARARSMPQDFKVDSEVKDAKIVLADGTELAAEIVLRDNDLDLALLRPREKPAKPLPALDLAQAARPQVLDQVVCLNRLGKVASRTATVSLERVAAVVERPRPFYVLDTGGSSGVSSPVFTLAGAPIGVILIRNATSEADTNLASLFSGPSGLGVMPVVVPAADVLEDVKQAMEEKRAPAADR